MNFNDKNIVKTANFEDPELKSGNNTRDRNYVGRSCVPISASLNRNNEMVDICTGLLSNMLRPGTADPYTPCIETGTANQFFGASGMQSWPTPLYCTEGDRFYKDDIDVLITMEAININAPEISAGYSHKWYELGCQHWNWSANAWPYNGTACLDPVDGVVDCYELWAWSCVGIQQEVNSCAADLAQQRGQLTSRKRTDNNNQYTRNDREVNLFTQNNHLTPCALNPQCNVEAIRSISNRRIYPTIRNNARRFRDRLHGRGNRRI